MGRRRTTTPPQNRTTPLRRQPSERRLPGCRCHVGSLLRSDWRQMSSGIWCARHARRITPRLPQAVGSQSDPAAQGPNCRSATYFEVMH